MVTTRMEDQTSFSFSKQSLADLADHLLKEGKKPAVINFTKNDRDEWTRQKIGQTAALLSEGLRRDGLEPDDKVLILAPPSPQHFTVLLAIMRVGGIMAPIDVQISDPHLEHIFENSEATLVFTTKRMARRLAQLGRNKTRRIFLLDAEESEENTWKTLWANEPGELAEVGGNDGAVLFYTSGTTGRPKGVPSRMATFFPRSGWLKRRLS